MRQSPSRLVLPLLGVAAVAFTSWRAMKQPTPGHPPDSAPGRTARRHRFGDYLVTGRTVSINAPRDRLYEMLRDPDILTRLMAGAGRVSASDGGLWHWTLDTVAGRSASFRTRFIEERPGKLLAWRTVAGSDLDMKGKVLLRDAPGERGTEVSAHVAHDPRAGTAGHWLAKLARRDPETRARHILKRFKMLVETGEIATTRTRTEA